MANADIKWLTEIADEDFKAAATYLQLIFSPGRAAAFEKKFKQAKTRKFPAKDVIRASGLSALGQKDPDVAKQMAKIKDQEPLSPVLLVRDKDQTRLIVADGFHRICAVVAIEANAPVHCKIV